VNEALQNSRTHVPVLLQPVIAGLNLHKDGLYIDATFGRGGHSLAILDQLGPAGRLLAIDRDPQAIDAVADAMKSDPRFELMQGEFSELKEYANKRNLLGKVDGLLLDLGVSSPQLDEAERGFSFQSDGPLDMRMDPTTGSSAADWLANVKERELRKVLFEFGEERFANRITKAIVAARASQPIRRTAELARIISTAVPFRGQKRHPATKTFQAIRIRINDELQQLEQALRATADLLRPGGRLCVISFHSLEDRRVKRFMREVSREAEPFRGLPDVPEEHRPPFKLVGKMISATDAEIQSNLRARSARLRVAERL